EALNHWLGRDSLPEGKVGKIAQVVLAPAVVTRILTQIAPWFSAENFSLGRSPLCTSTEIFSESVLLVDEGRHAHAAPFDMEGVPVELTQLVRQGKACGLLYDSYWGARENHPSTGNY